MNTTTLAATIALSSLLAGTIAGCASSVTREDAALQRAYQHRIVITGSRIKQQVEDGDPDVGYQLNSLTGAQAQEAVREMREEALRRTRRR